MPSIGDWEIQVAADSSFWADAGAMFHMVPRTLWESHVVLDDQHRLALALQCLVLRREDRVVLVDAGVGTTLPAEEAKHYGLNPDQSLITSLAALGIAPGDVTDVILTHLHLDHTGWLSTLGSDGGYAPLFVNARHFVQAAEWEAAQTQNPLLRGSYRFDTFRCLDASGRLNLVDGTHDVAVGLTLERVGFHSPGHQIVRVQGGGETLLHVGDLIPTVQHLRPAWCMAYDMEPWRVAAWKERLYSRIAGTETTLFLSHENDVSPFGRVSLNGQRVTWEPRWQGAFS